VPGVERLHAEAGTRDSCCTKAAQLLLAAAFERARIGLQGDLGAAVDPPQRIERAQDACDARWREQRRSASAEENRGDAAAGPSRLRSGEGRLANQRFDVALLRDRMNDVRVEVAVGAALRAVRKVDVDGKGLGRQL
jgi:hypothetical protein